ncbi:hypothetical protein MBM09_13245 [Flaviramulus sp. BrNp1-15]|uniref:hypothetical protein n=1 Tax=Flaviramulus sp. BrNp1-15 TaxID=2916754 RepID=UPI001EE856DE|nr:hypothetical protein [Flaviramulus sp. BrNp1-15]ULC58871.1 hypothetical protein MBM09_13245 [Flaviramulus sp. BrNp1-15]
MLGLLLIYFIGKRFYDLSVEYNQNKWLFAILSVVVYYAAGFVFGIVLAILDLYVFNWGIDWDNNFGINLLGLPVGLLAVWGFYMVLENKWKKTVVLVKDEIQDIGKNIEEN